MQFLCSCINSVKPEVQSAAALVRPAQCLKVTVERKLCCGIWLLWHMAVYCDFAVTESLVRRPLNSLIMISHHPTAEFSLTGSPRALKLPRALRWFTDPAQPPILRLLVLISVRRPIGKGFGAPSPLNVPRTVSLTTTAHIHRWT